VSSVNKTSLRSVDYNGHILITGLARNCACTIKNEVNTISAAFSNFSNVDWLIVESDSSDSTVEKLEEIRKEKSGFRYISCGVLEDKMPLRTQRISFCRNQYLYELHKNSIYKEVRYLAVVDLDGVNKELTKEGVESCWDRQDWAACSANQSKFYYDIFALRHDLWSPNNAFSQQLFFEKYGVSKFRSFLMSINFRMIHIPSNSEWIEVDSAFGGMAIYKVEFIQNAKYDFSNCGGVETCEHVAFNKSIRSNQGKIFINPKLVNCSYNEHSKYARPLVGLLRLWLRFFVKVLFIKLKKLRTW